MSLTTTEQIAVWADRLRDLSAEGLRYGKDPYDQERYHEVQDVALAMLARVTEREVEELEPLRESTATPVAPARYLHFHHDSSCCSQRGSARVRQGW